MARDQVICMKITYFEQERSEVVHANTNPYSTAVHLAIHLYPVILILQQNKKVQISTQNENN